MAEKFIIAVLLAVGLINAAPVMGLVSAERLQALYGIALEDSNLVLLMRHRALMLGLLGSFVLASIWLPAWRLPAMGAVGLSMVVFLLLAGAPSGLNAAVRKVYWIDLALCIALLPALVLQWRTLSMSPAP